MAFVLAFLLVLLGLMYWGWRGRQRRQGGIPKPQQVPAELGFERGTFEGFYVATTVSGQQLNRIAVGGLGFRAKVELVVADVGVAFGIPGENVFVPTADLTGVDRATWTIDRVVEENGLIRIAWNLGETAVESYFRVNEPDDLLAAVSAVMSKRTGATQ
ncbi:hypothetical protein EYE40_04705 [Glaciihabitans arcticus]|uniref:PH domain-containing protein n=1 Tax=Glaciihabitans arcticus TaxID=2668039 RepID=A0A4Q9GPN6_9MICO|nr:hypothetical protein [Glaciihabitans arcticus]TBN56756.1 hypothetical protein EYE40_04705 [Glaciihabitans arcticus]